MGKGLAITAVVVVLAASAGGVLAWHLGWLGSNTSIPSTQSPDVQHIVDLLRRADGRSLGYQTEREIARIVAKAEAPYPEVKRLLMSGDRDGAVAILLKQRTRTADAAVEASLSRDIGALELSGHSDAAHDAYSRAHRTDKSAIVAYQLAMLDLRRGKSFNDTAPFEAIVAQSDADAVVRSAALSMIAFLQASKAQTQLAVESAISAVAEAKRSGDNIIIASAMHNHAQILGAQGKPDEALEVAKSALAAAEHSGRKDLVASANLALGRAYLAVRRPDDARQATLQALSTMEKLGMREEAGACHTMLSTIAERVGDLDLARSEIRIVISGLRPDAPQLRYGVLANLARIEVKAGNLDAAEQTLNEAEAACVQIETPVCDMVLGPIRQSLTNAKAASTPP